MGGLFPWASGRALAGEGIRDIPWGEEEYPSRSPWEGEACQREAEGRGRAQASRALEAYLASLASHSGVLAAAEVEPREQREQAEQGPRVVSRHPPLPRSHPNRHYLPHHHQNRSHHCLTPFAFYVLAPPFFFLSHQLLPAELHSFRRCSVQLNLYHPWHFSLFSTSLCELDTCGS